MVQDVSSRRDARVLQQLGADRAAWVGVQEHEQVDGGPQHKLRGARRGRQRSVERNSEAIVRVQKRLAQMRCDVQPLVQGKRRVVAAQRIRRVGPRRQVVRSDVQQRVGWDDCGAVLAHVTRRVRRNGRTSHKAGRNAGGCA